MFRARRAKARSAKRSAWTREAWETLARRQHSSQNIASAVKISVIMRSLVAKGRDEKVASVYAESREVLTQSRSHYRILVRFINLWIPGMRTESRSRSLAGCFRFAQRERKSERAREGREKLLPQPSAKIKFYSSWLRMRNEDEKRWPAVPEIHACGPVVVTRRITLIRHKYFGPWVLVRVNPDFRLRNREEASVCVCGGGRD